MEERLEPAMRARLIAMDVSECSAVCALPTLPPSLLGGCGRCTAVGMLSGVVQVWDVDRKRLLLRWTAAANSLLALHAPPRFEGDAVVILAYVVM
jgi:hypothetical protein